MQVNVPPDAVRFTPTLSHSASMSVVMRCSGARFIRRTFAVRAVKRRIAEHVVIVALHVRRQIQHVDRDEHRRDRPIRSRSHCRSTSPTSSLSISAPVTDARHARRQTQARRPRAAAQFQYIVTALGRHRRGQHHRVESGAKSLCELAHGQPAAQETCPRSSRRVARGARCLRAEPPGRARHPRRRP